MGCIHLAKDIFRSYVDNCFQPQFQAFADDVILKLR